MKEEKPEWKLNDNTCIEPYCEINMCNKKRDGEWEHWVVVGGDTYLNGKKVASGAIACWINPKDVGATDIRVYDKPISAEHAMALSGRYNGIAGMECYYCKKLMTTTEDGESVEFLELGLVAVHEGMKPIRICTRCYHTEPSGNIVLHLPEWGHKPNTHGRITGIKG